MSMSQHEYRFGPSIQLKDAEALLQLAVLSVEGLFGAATVRMRVAYERDPELGAITIDTATVAGDAVARIFTGLAIREFGEAAFEVRQVVDGDDPPEFHLAEVGVA